MGIPNPLEMLKHSFVGSNYKGKWKSPKIDNPDFKDDPDLYVFSNLKYVTIELWQVKSGTLFDNILSLLRRHGENRRVLEKEAFDEAEEEAVGESDGEDEDGSEEVEDDTSKHDEL